MIKAVIFDMDGTLLNSEELWFSSARDILKKYNAALTEREYRAWVGRDETPLLHEKAAAGGYKADGRALSAERAELVLDTVYDYPMKADENLMKLIPELKGKGIRIGLATGTRSIVTVAFLQKLEIKEVFDAIITSTDVTNKKPDPETYFACAKALEVSPEECLVFEDSSTGVESAKAAGMICIAVPTNLSISQDFSRADLVVNERKKISMKILSRWIE
jgi:HAD superfamily hydrolase (TIGR01509 family)